MKSKPVKNKGQIGNLPGGGEIAGGALGIVCHWLICPRFQGFNFVQKLDNLVN